MAPKPHRSATGMTRHSRSASGGSSKVGLNLNFTQKEPVALPTVRKPKVNGIQARYEPPARPSGHPSRTSSDHRIHAKTVGHPMNSSRAVMNPPQQPHVARSKADFTIARIEGDEDEWVSSESGPATPDHQSDEELTSPVEPPTPVEHVPPRLIPVVPSEQNTISNAKGNEVATTPRAGLTPPTSSPKPPTAPSIPPPSSDEKLLPSQPDPSARFANNQNRTQNHSMIEVQTITKKAPVVKQLRPEVSPPQSPPPQHHGRTISSHRHSTTRPPSLYSITSKSDFSSRPHPLIRGQSTGLGPGATPPRQLPLAPLTTIPASDHIGIGHLSSSPPQASPLSQSSISPAPSFRTPSTARDDYAPSEARRQLRRQSTSSSQASIATIPHQSAGPRTAPERQRTLSTMSTSSLAALSPFAYSHFHTSPPRSPIVGFVSHFPAGDEINEASDLIHSLLPPPYLTAHQTVLTHRDPIQESYERVAKAKRLQR